MFQYRVAILGLLLSSAAQAAPVTFYFGGTVNQAASFPHTTPPVTVDEHISIAITIEDAFPSNTPGGGTYSFTGGNPVTGFSPVISSAIFAGIDESGLFQTVTVSPGSEISFNTGSPQTSSGFNLVLSGAVAGALPTTALPLALTASEFTAGTFSVTEAFSPTIDGFSGVIDGLASPATTVPEPASWAVLAFGLAGLAWFRNRAGRIC